MTLEEWRSVMAVNLDGVFLCTKHAGAAMAAAGGGSIINVASIKAFGGVPGHGQLRRRQGRRRLADEDRGDRAARPRRAGQCALPGLGSTPTSSPTTRPSSRPCSAWTFDEIIDHIQGRLATPEEIAGVAVFLASDRSRFSSGSTYNVDGGATAPSSKERR